MDDDRKVFSVTTTNYQSFTVVCFHLGEALKWAKHIAKRDFNSEVESIKPSTGIYYDMGQ